MSQGEDGKRNPRTPHAAVLVENVPLGQDNRLQKQVAALLAADYRVSVVTRRDPANEPFRHTPGLRLVEHPAPRDGSSTLGHLREYAVSLLWQAPALLRLHRRDPIDVLQLCQPPDLFFPFANVAHRLGGRVLLDQRDLMPETLIQRYETVPSAPMKVLGWLERQTQRNVDHTVTVNGYLRDRLVGAGGAAERVSLVYNGPLLARVDTAMADPLPRGRHRHLVCWAGKMGKQDRVHQVLEVAHHVVHELGRTDCGFLIIGDGECLEALQSRAGELGLADWVEFPGWVSEHELYRHLAACDVGIDTSLQEEVTPVKAMEYMAVGLPVLSYDVEQTRVLVEDAGVRVPSGDSEVLAKELLALLDGAEKRRRMGELGRRKIEQHLAWERQAEGYLAVMDALTHRLTAMT